MLGIDYDADERTIKRAYAALIKQYRPETHPADFARVRDAYEEAVYHWRENLQWQPEPESTAQAVSEAADADGLEPVSAADTEMVVVTHLDATQDVAPAPEQLLLQGITAKAGEQARLKNYHEQTAELFEWPLDQQINFENALRYWLLFSDDPALLVFQAADARYHWSSNSMEIVRLYGSEAGSRFYVLKKLAELYAQARSANIPFLKFESAPEHKPILFADHYHTGQADDLCENWRRYCNDADYEKLAQRIGRANADVWQLYWVDMAFGLSMAGLVWLLTRIEYSQYAVLFGILAGSVSAIVPAVTRSVHGMSFSGYNWVEKIRRWRQTIKVNKTLDLYIWIVVTLFGMGLYGAIARGMMPTPLIYVVALAGVVFILVGCYKVLATLEAMIVRAGIRILHFVELIRGNGSGQQLQSPREIVNALLLNMKKKLKAGWAGVRSATYWWIVIWVVSMQVIRALSGH